MLRFSFFQNYPQLIHGITTKSEGNIDPHFGNKKQVGDNLTTIVEHLSPQVEGVIQFEQVHGADILVINSKAKRDKYLGKVVINKDGIISNQKDSLLMARSADCIPLFLYNPKNQAVGLIHVGWRGAVAKIHLKAIDILQTKLKSNARDILIGIGPGICGNCYESKQTPQQANQKDWQQFINKDRQSWRIDLPGFVEKSLVNLGINKKNIETMNICTFENKNLFSHQRSKNTGEQEGRFASLIGIKA